MAGEDKTGSSWLLERQKSMVMQAAKEGMSNLVVLALDHNPKVPARQLAEPRSPQEVPLVTACRQGHLEVVQSLLETCQAPLRCTGQLEIDGEMRDGVTPLWAAVCSGQVELVRYLLQKGADANEHASRMSSPLRAACYLGNEANVRLLVEQGADVNDVNFMGHSVLMVACYRKNTGVVRLLLDSQADVNYVVPDMEDSNLVGRTALHDCADVGDVDIARLLISRGATVTHNQQGQTPLMMAAYKGHDDLVFYLADTPDCSRDDKADGLEVLGVHHLEKRVVDGCLGLWQRAMAVRHAPRKPAASKRVPDHTVAAFGHAVEVQTPDDLRALQTSRDERQLHVQAMLTLERVLGTTSTDTNDFVEYVAAVRADDDDMEGATTLLLHILDNLSHTSPFLLRTVDTYAFLLGILFSALEQNDAANISREVLSYTLKTLKRGMADLQRGDSSGEKSASSETNAMHRQKLLRIFLHLVVLAGKAHAQAWTQGHTTGTEEKSEVQDIVRQLMKQGVRGEKGSTLLHMAVDKCTMEFRNGDWQAFTFPSLEAVKALLEAGCDVNTMNEAGQTALEFLRSEDTGDHSDIVDALVASGAR